MHGPGKSTVNKKGIKTQHYPVAEISGERRLEDYSTSVA